jgi:hypothetical protein
MANSHALHFTTAHTKSPQSAVSSPVDVTLLPGSRSRRLATISHQPPIVLFSIPSQDPPEKTAGPRHRPHREYRFQQLLQCRVLHNRYIAMSVSLVQQFLLWANMPQYYLCVNFAMLYPGTARIRTSFLG